MLSKVSTCWCPCDDVCVLMFMWICHLYPGFYYLDQAWLQPVHQGQWEVGKRWHWEHRPGGRGQNPRGGHGIFGYVDTLSVTLYRWTIYRKRMIEVCFVYVQLCSGSAAMSFRTLKRSWLRSREERPESRGESASRKHWTLKWAALLSRHSIQ